MKNITRHTVFLLFGLMIGFTSIRGQVHSEEVVVPLSNPGKSGILEVHVHRGKVSVEGTSSNSEILVQINSVEGKDNKEKSYPNGLKRIPNTSNNVRITEDGNRVEIWGDHSNRRSDFVIQVPQNFSLEIHTHHNGDVNVSNVVGAMELNSHHGPITATNVGGSVVANTHHGSIQVDFKQVESDVPMAFSTYHGDVKVNFPGNTAFSGKLKSARGEILTDFEMDVKQRREPQKEKDKGHFEVNLGGWVYTEINGGGQEYMFTTHHGDIIIQKN